MSVSSSTGPGPGPAAGPRDPYNIVYFIFYWLGMGTLLPWNFVITVHGYWMEKFHNATASNSSMTVPGSDEPLTPLQLSWNSYLSIASMIPNVTFLLLNAAFGHKFKTQPRLIISMVVIIFCFIFNDAMAVIDTDDFQGTFLALTLFVVVIVNICVAILQGGLSGVAAKFPPAYMGAVVQGQGLGGTFAAACNIIFLAMGASYSITAFCCFLISILFLGSALIAFCFVTRTEFFKYHFGGHGHRPEGDQAGLLSSAQDEADPSKSLGNEVPAAERPAAQQVNVLQIAGQIWIWIVAVFVNFLVTLAVFPAVTSLVVSTGKGSAWSDIYFIPVGCFLMFNIGDYIGRLLGSWFQWPKNTRSGAIITLLMSLLRLVFIPIFVFCNASPANRVHTDVVIYSDAAYVVLVLLFSISNGYIGTICMIFAPKMLTEPECQATAAATMVSFLVLGLAFGSIVSSATLLIL